MLKITGDGRKAALDMRLVDRPAGQRAPPSSRSPPSTIAGVWREHRDRAYLDPVTGGAAHRHRARCRSCSATSPPRAERLERLRRAPRRSSQARGVPADQVRYIHEARNDAEKAPAVRRLPRRARRGDHRLDGEDGGRHQHPGPRDRPAPPRLSVAARRHRAARRADPAPGQPEPRGRDLPLRRRRQLRCLHAGRRSSAKPGSSTR